MSSSSISMENNNNNKGKNLANSNGESEAPQEVKLSRYEAQKRRDWNTFGQYLRNRRPPVALPECKAAHVVEFLRYLDQFGKTKVHSQGCPFFGRPDPPAPCPCPLRQAWGSLDALIGRLRAAFEELAGLRPEDNPFAFAEIRVYLREVRDSQGKARGIPYTKKKKKNNNKKRSTDHGVVLNTPHHHHDISS